MSPKPTPLTYHPPSLLTRLYYRLLALYLSITIARRITAFRKSYPQFWTPIAPTLTKSYPIAPALVHRFFFPPDHRPNQSHPVLILIHGGGWVFGSPSMDDQQATLLSKKGYLVVSVAYPLSPRHAYPTAIHSIEQSVHCVLADPSLPLSRTSPLVIGGFSAGGVMALALAQLPSLRDRVTAVVSFFPLTDFTGRGRGEFRSAPWGEEDVLTRTLGMFTWAYVPTGAELTEPGLSVGFATRRELRCKVMVVAAERDCLADEAGVFAARLAGRQIREGGWDYRESWEDEGEGVRYLCVRDMPHSFTHFWVRPGGEWAERKEDAVRETWESVGEWLEGAVKGEERMQKGRL